MAVVMFSHPRTRDVRHHLRRTSAMRGVVHFRWRLGLAASRGGEAAEVLDTRHDTDHLARASSIEGTETLWRRGTYPVLADAFRDFTADSLRSQRIERGAIAWRRLGLRSASSSYGVSSRTSTGTSDDALQCGRAAGRALVGRSRTSTTARGHAAFSFPRSSKQYA